MGRQELVEQINIMRELLRYKMKDTNDDQIESRNNRSRTDENTNFSEELTPRHQNMTSNQSMMNDWNPLIQPQSPQGRNIEEEDSRHREISEKLKHVRNRVQKLKTTKH